MARSFLTSAALAVALIAGSGLTAAGRAEAAASDAAVDKGSLAHIADVVGATASYDLGWTGRGVGVALIDTGVAPVPGLDSGNVVTGPDLSLDAAIGGPRHVDAYGHGTHLAAIIAGRDRVDTPAGYASGRTWHGIAPDATLVNMRVGAQDGAVDVSQVIAAVDWVVQHRDDGGRNIRVINLSYGNDARQDSLIDPLAFAVENAWRHGIVVVAAAGNDGREKHRLASPAVDPHVIAVGAADTAGTLSVADDTVPEFTTRGTSERHADLVAPGVSVLGLRDPGSAIDDANPGARVEDRFFRGTGTSQATAVVSGAVALLLQRDPALTPDQVKAALLDSARPLPDVSRTVRGAGLLQVLAAGSLGVDSLGVDSLGVDAADPAVPYGDGSGSLEGARGSVHLVSDGVPLTGERDIQGAAWDGPAWAARTSAGMAWDGECWNGAVWGSGDGSNGSWSGQTWVGQTWVGQTWVGQTWVGQTWVGQTWVGQTWVGQTWVGKTWTGQTWVGQTWVGQTWVGQTWVGQTWLVTGWTDAAWS